MQSADEFWGSSARDGSARPTPTTSCNRSSPQLQETMRGSTETSTVPEPQRRLPGDTPAKTFGGRASDPEPLSPGFYVRGGGARFRSAARRYDVDDTGVLSRQQLSSTLHDLCIPNSFETAERVSASVDPRRSGLVPYNKLIPAIDAVSAPDSKRHAAAVLQRIATVANDHGVDLASEFSKKDVAQCGLLSLSDAKRCFADVGVPLSDADVRALMSRCGRSLVGSAHIRLDYNKLLDTLDGGYSCATPSSTHSVTSVSRFDPGGVATVQSLRKERLVEARVFRTVASSVPRPLLSVMFQKSSPFDDVMVSTPTYRDTSAPSLRHLAPKYDETVTHRVPPHCHLKASEFRERLALSGVHLAQDDWLRLLRRVDPHGSGVVSYDNACSVLGYAATDGHNDRMVRTGWAEDGTSTIIATTVHTPSSTPSEAGSWPTVPVRPYSRGKRHLAPGGLLFGIPCEVAGQLTAGTSDPNASTYRNAEFAGLRHHRDRERRSSSVVRPPKVPSSSQGDANTNQQPNHPTTTDVGASNTSKDTGGGSGGGTKVLRLRMSPPPSAAALLSLTQSHQQ